MNAPDILTLTETAKRLGVHRNTLARWARKKKVPHLRPSRRTILFNWGAVCSAIGGNKS